MHQTWLTERTPNGNGPRLIFETRHSEHFSHDSSCHFGVKCQSRLILSFSAPPCCLRFDITSAASASARFHLLCPPWLTCWTPSNRRLGEAMQMHEVLFDAENGRPTGVASPCENTPPDWCQRAYERWVAELSYDTFCITRSTTRRVRSYRKHGFAFLRIAS